MHQPSVLGALFPINQSDPASPPSQLAFILWAFPAFPELILLRLRRQCNFAEIHNVSRLARAMTTGEGEWGENEATGWLLMKGRFATVPSLHALSVFIAFMPLVFGTPLVITITIHPIILISMEPTGGGTEGRSLSNISNFAHGNLLAMHE